MESSILRFLKLAYCKHDWMLQDVCWFSVSRHVQALEGGGCLGDYFVQGRSWCCPVVVLLMGVAMLNRTVSCGSLADSWRYQNASPLSFRLGVPLENALMSSGMRFGRFGLSGGVGLCHLQWQE